MPRQVQVVVIPVMDELCGRIGQLQHPLFDLPETDVVSHLVDDADARMLETERYGVLVVDEERGVAQSGLLQEAGKGFACERVTTICAHQTVDFHRNATHHSRRPLQPLLQEVACNLTPAVS